MQSPDYTDGFTAQQNGMSAIDNPHILPYADRPMTQTELMQNRRAIEWDNGWHAAYWCVCPFNPANMSAETIPTH